ncbi:MAG: hypothetical protein JWQ23_3674 [Herminiimonas sp.]|nr:hypothetical protein [Herminiimonas sp.]
MPGASLPLPERRFLRPGSISGGAIRSYPLTLLFKL